MREIAFRQSRIVIEMCILVLCKHMRKIAFIHSIKYKWDSANIIITGSQMLWAAANQIHEPRTAIEFC